MTEVVIQRSQDLIPTAFAWGWEIPVYLFLGGLTAGLMILSAGLGRRCAPKDCSNAVRFAPLAAPIIITIGMITLFADLSHKPMVYNFYLTLQPSSPMSWGSWILLVVYPATILLGLSNLTTAETERIGRWSPVAKLRLARPLTWLQVKALAWRKPLLAANLATGVGLGIYTGILLEGLGIARPLWNSLALGPLFLVSGLSTGAALLMLLPVKHDEHIRLRRWDLAAIGLELALLLGIIASLAMGGGLAGRKAAHLLLGGEYTALFWSLVVVVGLLVPLLFESVEAAKRLRPSALAPVMLLVGGFALRWILVMAGQA